MTTNQMSAVKRLAYFMYVKLPPGNDLCDIEQEALLGAIQATDDTMIIAAKRAVIQYLRRCYPGSRSGSPMRFCQDVPDRLTRPTQHDAIDIQAVRNAVDLLTGTQLMVVKKVFFEEMSTRDAAKHIGITEAHACRTKAKALKAMAATLSGGR